ncbi:MAG: hypothetical protein WA799_08975 [Nitrosotalea sp.]
METSSERFWSKVEKTDDGWDETEIKNIKQQILQALELKKRVEAEIQNLNDRIQEWNVKLESVDLCVEERSRGCQAISYFTLELMKLQQLQGEKK